MRREYLKAVVCALFSEVGYETMDHIALETLTEMTQSMLTEIGRSSQSYCELANRIQPIAADVILAAINMGINLNGIADHAFRANRSVIPTPSISLPPKQTNILQLGNKQPHPSYVPDHLPQFPDPHAYIRTPTHKKPVTEYEAIREKAACQKNNVEHALNRYLTRTNPTESLFFNEENDCFQLIAAKPQFPPYLIALLPKDQVYDQEEDDGTSSSPHKRFKDDKEAMDTSEEETSKMEIEAIDNPYLRPAKLPLNPLWPKPKS